MTMIEIGMRYYAYEVIVALGTYLVYLYSIQKSKGFTLRVTTGLDIISQVIRRQPLYWVYFTVVQSTWIYIWVVEGFWAVMTVSLFAGVMVIPVYFAIAARRDRDVEAILGRSSYLA